MPEEQRWLRWARGVALVACPFDLLLGLGLVILAGLTQDIMKVSQGPEPAFIRMTGLFTVLLGVMYLRVLRDPGSNLNLFQVTCLARGMLALLHFSEAQFLVPGPVMLAHYLFYAMSAADLILFVTQAHILGRLGKGWFVI